MTTRARRGGTSRGLLELFQARRSQARAWNELYAAADAAHPSRLDREDQAIMASLHRP